jgi:ABC-2 type transport system ATP-binding protein
MILEIKELSKTYKTNRKKQLVLDSVSFHVDKGEIFSILGENGAGKTTLIKLMVNLLTPSKGKILYKNMEITTIGKDYYTEIGVVLEGNRNIYWYLSAYENILYFGRLMGLKEKEIRERGEELLKFFGLYEDKDKKVGNFSRGMQQKLSIIISLLHEPKILFLDEPTLGLDVVSKMDMIEKIKHLSKEDGVTVIITSHQMDVVEKVADRVMILGEGEIQFLDTVDKLINKYSGNKYLIRVERNLDDAEIKKYFDTVNVVRRENDITEIEVYIDSNRLINSFLGDMVKRNIYVTHISKSQDSLEDIMYKFLKLGSDSFEDV